jgi:hypothetical protein
MASSLSIKGPIQVTVWCQFLLDSLGCAVGNGSFANIDLGNDLVG